VAEERAAVQVEDAGGEERHAEQERPRPVQRLKRPEQALPRGAQVADRKSARDPGRQHEARDEGGGREASDRVQAQLRQPLEVRRQERGEAGDGGEYPEAYRRPDIGAPVALRRSATLYE